MIARLRYGWPGALVLLALCIAPGAAHALEIPPGGVTLEVLNAAGQPEARAGSHPDKLVQGFEFSDSGGEAEDPKDVIVDLPSGLSGDTGAVPPCPRQIFSEYLYAEGICKAESQIGVLLSGLGESEESTPLYSVESGPNEVAVFGAFVGAPPVMLTGDLRPGDLGLSLRLSDISQSSFGSLEGARLELWGIPADHQLGTSIPRKPLLTLPSRCDTGPLATTVSMRTWQHPDRWSSQTADTGHSLLGCEELPFEANLGFSLEHPSADTPSGVGIELDLPQSEDPDALATAQLEEANIALPKGMTISPGGAEGFSACTDAQFGLGAATEVACPPASKVGTVALEAPALSKPLQGSIYLATEAPTERIRLFIAAAAKGSEVKLTGALHTDPDTGELTATLKELPEASLAKLALHFDGGPGALLATPLNCGPATTTATLTPYSATTPLERESSVELSAPGGNACPAQPPFAPTFSGGATSSRAGHPTAFTATIHRQDGEELPERLQISLPPGMSASLGSVDPCPQSALAKESCPGSSLLGKAVAELGPGGNPATIDGQIYLTGPYRKAPFGVALSFKPKLGPFALGPLSIRTTLAVDPLSGQLTLESDRLPTVLEGIPIRFQTLGLDLDRPGLMQNPTSCAPTTVDATLHSTSGAIARPSTPFALHGCIALPFAPKLSVSLSGQGELEAGGRPSLRLGLHTKPKSANLRSLKVSFPKLLKFDSNGLAQICDRQAASKGQCPKAARVGTVKAKTPLLGTPMKGSLYIAQPPDQGQPDIWAHLAGEGLEVDLRGQTESRDGHPVTRFEAMPDFPLRDLALVFSGGPHGLVELRGDPCGRALLAPSALGGQSGARVERRVRVGVGCGG